MVADLRGCLIRIDKPKHFSFISLDEFVIMSNHIHGILIIEPMTAVRTLHVTSMLRCNDEIPLSEAGFAKDELKTLIYHYIHRIIICYDEQSSDSLNNPHHSCSGILLNRHMV